MATHKSAEKRNRQNQKRNERNRQNRATLRTAVKKALIAAKAGDKATAQSATTEAVRLLDKAVNKGLLHKNNASRRVSRLTKRVNELSA
jgi:small subunit ribosomal protein S20